ncbi:GH116 family glycosyl hydrolase [uncultured Fibrobacter sp.]|uniref:GH116 family glycosyl hydrolase n=1 Tax=uncultured Fibrobacter sp. TaxID=261512 RepID=UPI0026097B2E|nr:GH116 family glycosyl hydrolase [uncultured Fibrobacter sp.]
MSIKDYLAGAKQAGSVQKLMTPGLAVEFIQPWYTPLSTTPSTTGIAVGGIGSTFTATPAGTTPVMNVMPGVQVRTEKPSDLRFNNFFFRESVIGAKAALEIGDFAGFTQMLAKYPLVDAKGEALFSATELANQKKAEAKLNKTIAEKDFFNNNKADFERWHIEWSDRTAALLNKAGAELNRSAVIDFFNGVVGEKVVRQGALTAAWANDSEFLGQAGYDAAKMQYAALYPVSETKYEGKGVQITKTQSSYVTPGDERLSSLPVNATVFTLENTTKETREITIVQVQDCIAGYMAKKDRQGVQDSSFVLVPSARFPKGVKFSKQVGDREVRGLEFYNEKPLAESDFNGCMGVSVAWNKKDNLNVSVKPMFYQDDAASVLKGALRSGRVCEAWVKNVYSGRETMAGAVAVTAVLKPKQKVSFQFNLVLDFPEIKLNKLTSAKKYTAFFPEAYGRVGAILVEALAADKNFDARLKAFEALVPKKAVAKLYKTAAKQDEFKSLAINTLSFLAEATVWDKEDRFLVRECADYPFFNSLDVYFYGSFSLMALMPRLDGVVMKRFGDAILAVNDNRRRHHEYVNHPFADLPDPKLEGPRAVRGAVIHDLGSPFDAEPDAYDWHNVKEWKDLAPKYVLMVLRHYVKTQDKQNLQDCKEAVYAAMQYLEKMVNEGENFPLTHGTDDTFDNLSSHGISVYCGSLWIAGLRAAAKIAEILGDKAQADTWNAKADAANKEFDEALWDEAEGYYHFFVTPMEAKDVVADKLPQLADAIKETLVIDGKNVKAALKTINEWLNSGKIPSDVELSKNELRGLKKAWLTAQCKDAFTASWNAKIANDCDDVFADTMLADTYLRLLGLKPISDEKKAKANLLRVFNTNYKANSPLIGAANLVRKDGSPLDEFNFQAHDVWIGIQYSIMCAMMHHGLEKQAADMGDSMIRNLYEEARIPFAAPEGFNGSCRLHPEALVKAFGLSATAADKMHKELLKKGALLADSRISPKLPRNLPAFTKAFGSIAKANKVEVSALFMLLHSTALKYTAGKYFRPGMVFALLY